MKLKNILISAVLMSMMFSKVMAETYLPLYADKKLIFSTNYYFLYLNEDTAVNLKKYIKVYRGNSDRAIINLFYSSQTVISNLDSIISKRYLSLEFLIREDTMARKVFIIDIISRTNVEIELDLAMNPFQHGLYYSPPLQNAIYGNISEYGVRRRCLVGSCCGSDFQGFIEGIGPVGYTCQCGNPKEPSTYVKYIVFRDGRIEKYNISMLTELGVENKADGRSLDLVDFKLNHSQLTFTLCGEHASVPAQCKVYGANGSVVFNGKIGSTPQTVSTASLSPGIYLAVVTTSAGEVLGRHKFVVK